MDKLSAIASKDEYRRWMGKQVKLGRFEVTVIEYKKEGRSGTYEKGFKFTTNVYGGLKKKTGEMSFDHGATWSWGMQYEVFKKSTRNARVRLESDSQKEFAYDAIQAINRRYEARWD